MFVIGLMSGTSLDGLDVAYCEFFEDNVLHYRLLAAETYPYPPHWVERLSSLERASAFDYALANVELGHYFGRRVNEFRQNHPGPVDLVASHGHTVFHQPHIRLTTQIADGDAIAAETHLPVAFNFRTLDVALGGQGAPLVPVGDRLLFGDCDACLNLGGFSNVSFERDGRRIAFDLSPCNMALNSLAARLGLAYDDNGDRASMGLLDDELLCRLNALPYYSQPAPKSLGKEWYVSEFAPLIATGDVASLLRTVVEHIASQVAAVVCQNGLSSMLVTGGGARNGFLLGRLRSLCLDCRIVVPAPAVIDYKEAIVFALLGYLRVHHRPNCLSSVTGAAIDNCGGQLSGLTL